jgi:hypothetical protein
MANGQWPMANGQWPMANRRASAPIGSAASDSARSLGKTTMPTWKADLDALVEQTMAFTKSVRAQQPMPRTIVEPNRVPAVNWMNSERDEIEDRVAKFRAHQMHLIREREEYAKSQVKRMQASLAISEVRRLQTLPR